jgi:hypothetical protein
MRVLYEREEYEREGYEKEVYEEDNDGDEYGREE